MPAGFGSRLREKIESTRSNSSSLGSGSGAGGLGATKNIRGLTRLSGGTSAPSANGDANNLAAENQGGLLARKPDANNTPPSPDKTAKSSAGASASSALDTNGSSLMSSHPGSATAATSAALGGSKIVPGWGAATSGHLGGINSKNKNNGVSKDQQGGAAVNNGPWALQQSSTSVSAGQVSLPADSNIANYPSSQKPRWGDEDDDSDDEEFPQIGKESTTNNTSSSVASNSRGSNDNAMTKGGYSNNNYYGGGGGKFSDRDSNRDYQQSGRRSYNDRYSNDRYETDHYNNHRDYHHSQRGGYNNSYREDYSRGGDDRGFRDYSGHRGGNGYDNRSSSSYHHNHRDDYNDNRRSSSSFYNDRRYYNDDQSPTQSSRNDSRWGFAQRAPSHFSDRRSSEDYRHRSGSIENNNSHFEYRSSRRAGGLDGERGEGYHDRDGGDRYGFGRKEDTRRGGSEEERRMRSSSVASNNVEDSLKQQLRVDANERINRSMPETPMLLLRNTNNANTASTVQGANQPSVEVSRESDNGSNTAKIDEVNPVDSSKAWEPITPAEPTPTSSLNPKLLTEEQNATTPQPSSPVKERSPEEEAQFKKEQAIEQQQSILRQVAERRAARVSRTESEISAAESRSESEEQWERGQKVETKRNDNATQILAKKPNPCRKKGHDHDWADCPDNPNSDAYVNKTIKKASKKAEKVEGGNPCRKPGHDHDWSHCPDNRESEEYAARMDEKKQMKLEKEKRKIEKQQQKAEKPRPCRIEGHDHDWRDCPKNPKSANFIRDNPCQIEGHDHDWVDCPDNPKSENYRPPKRKGKKTSKRSSTKDAHEGDESETEEKGDDVEQQTKPRSKKQDDVARRRREEGRNLAAKENEEAHAKDVPVESVSEEAVEERKPEFVPAPPPKVPAWSSGPPASVRNASPLPSSEAVDVIEPTPVQATSDPAHSTSTQPATQHQNTLPPQVENNENLTFSRPQNVPHTTLGTPHSGSISTQSTMQSQPILPPPNALFPGNSALFGESQGSSVYGSWNPPPMVLPSTYVDPWKPNPFAPVSSTTASISPSLGGIWSGAATKVEVSDATENATEAIHDAAPNQLTNAEIAPVQNETKAVEQKEASTSESAESVEGPDEEDTKASQKIKKSARKPRPVKKGGKGKPRKQVKPNPCRKPGHDHDWKDCPDNPRSESYVGASHEESNGGKKSECAEPSGNGNVELVQGTDPSAPTLGVDKRKSASKLKKKDSGLTKCRIEGHDHLWKDCPNNKKGRGKGSKFVGKKKPKVPKKGEKVNTSESSQPIVEESS